MQLVETPQTCTCFTVDTPVFVDQNSLFLFDE
jgi:hypothetical protein